MKSPGILNLVLVLFSQTQRAMRKRTAQIIIVERPPRQSSLSNATADDVRSHGSQDDEVAKEDVCEAPALARGA